MFDHETVHNLNALANAIEVTGMKIKTSATVDELAELQKRLEDHGSRLFYILNELRHEETADDLMK